MPINAEMMERGQRNLPTVQNSSDQRVGDMTDFAPHGESQKV